MEKKITMDDVNALVKGIQDWFNGDGGCPNGPAVIGLSGGKDSTIIAALCVRALGKQRVFGVLMPNGVQSDIKDSYEVVNTLDIPYSVANIGQAYTAIINQLETPQYGETRVASEQTRVNLAPRLRMATLYAYSQTLKGRVMNTCNKSETMTGYETRWGDAVGDYAPFAEFTVHEVLQIGDLLPELPQHLVHKTPSDGLCGKTDEDNLGVTYKEIDEFLLNNKLPDEPERAKRLNNLIEKSRFKREPIPWFHR